MKTTTNVAELQAIAKQIRRDIIEMITAAKSGHPGGSLSAVEILVTLYFDVMRHDPANPKWPDRDRFILSKGHARPVLYAVMAESGYTPKDQLKNLRKLGSIYQGHPDVRFIPALEASTGSLGEGLSLGIGMALARKAGSAARPAPMWCWATARFRKARSGKRRCSARSKGGQHRRHRRLQQDPVGRLREGHHGSRAARPTNGGASAGTSSKLTATAFRRCRRRSPKLPPPRASRL